MASVYPNGQGDINQFEAAGGLAVIVAELLSAGLLHEDVETIVGSGLKYYGFTHGRLANTFKSKVKN